MTAKAPGKLVVFGEYAVLEGQTALVVSVDRYARCKIESAPEFSLSSSGFGSFNASNLVTAPPIIQAIFSDPPYPQAHIHIQSGELFLDGNPQGCKLGLGSSAAVSTALLKALCRWTGRHQSLSDIFSTAHTAHHRAQGLGSGLDIAAAVFGGVFQYQLHASSVHPRSTSSTIMAVAGDHIAHLKRHAIHPHTPILGVHLGQAASTPQFVRAVQALKREQPKVYAHHMDALGRIARHACIAWEAHDSDALMAYCIENNRTLHTLGQQAKVDIIPPRLEALNTALSAVNTVAKTTGAGGGDMAWVVCKGPEHAIEIEHHLSENWSVNAMQVAPVSIK